MGVHKRKDTKKVSYQARWADPSGKTKSKDFKTKAEAERYVIQMKANVARAEYSDPLAGKTRVKTVYENWVPSSVNLKPKTRNSYDSLWRCLVEPVWGNRTIISINRSEIKEWMIERTSTTGKIVSSSRMRQAYVLLKILLDHAVDMNLIARSPILENSSGKLKNLLPIDAISSQKRILELDELVALADACGEYRTMILLAGFVGFRWAEIIALAPEDFDFKNESILVNKSLTEVNGHFQLVTPKTGQSRTLPMPNFLKQDLKELVLLTPSNTPVFKGKEGGYLRHSNFSRRVLKPALAKIGVRDFTFHSLRHTAISQAIASNVSILDVSKIAGHSKPSTTLNIYGHLLNDSMKDFRSAIDTGYAKVVAR
jgi:integrase